MKIQPQWVVTPGKQTISNTNTLEWDDYRVMHWNIIIRYGNKFECCDWNNALKWWNVKIRYCSGMIKVMH